MHNLTLVRLWVARIGKGYKALFAAQADGLVARPARGELNRTMPGTVFKFLANISWLWSPCLAIRGPERRPTAPAHGRCPAAWSNNP